MTSDSLRKPALILAIATAALLLVPAVAMRYTREVSWGPGDFVVAAVLLYGAGFTAVLLARRLERRTTRVLAVGGVVLALALVWVELAVGIFH